jgi:16S rRNA G966 N2-methylase RsmD
MEIIVTTTQSKEIPDKKMDLFLEDSGLTFVPRQRKSLPVLISENEAGAVVVWEDNGPVLYMEDQKFFFHPSMAKNRISGMRHDLGYDVMAKACGIEAGDSFLDCTLGMGADAIVASYLSGGKIVGLEKSPGISHVIKWGMRNYNSRMIWLNNAIHRIEVIQSDHLDFLKEQPDHSFDIIYFDPMFRRPLLNSQPLAPLRLLADPTPLSLEAVAEARRVARKRVVMKELVTSGEFERLGFKLFPGSKHNRIGYGYIDID